MAEAVVSVVLERLEEIMISEVGVKLFSGANIKRQIEGARDKLAQIRCLLKDADAKQGDNEAVRNWVAEIREAACDLEDVIESYVSKEANSKRKICVVKMFACIGTPGKNRKIASELERIDTEFSDALSNRVTVGITQLSRENDGGAMSYSFRRDHMLSSVSHFRERHIVGLDEDVKVLVGHLVEDVPKSSYRVVSVWGMGGLGKTTIAQEVYRNSTVRNHFDCFAWVCVSQRFLSRDVLEAILTQLISANEEQRREFSRMNGQEIA